MPIIEDSQRHCDDWRTQPMYSFKEAAHLAHVSPSTVRNWLRGYSTPTGQVVPPLLPSDEPSPSCSFLQLIEIIVAATFRKAAHVPFQRVRRAYENARRLSASDYPFAHLELKAIGGHIVHVIRKPELAASYQAVDQPEQWTLPDLVQKVIAQIDYEDELAARWHPLGKNIPIVVDPRISAGLPVVLGRGVTVEVIRRRWKVAKQKSDFIARDLALDRDTVEQVLQYADEIAA